MQINKYARQVFKGKGGVDRFLRDLDSDISELHRLTTTALRYKSFIVTLTISDQGTKVFHHLGKIPVGVRILPKADARVWEVQGTRNSRSVTLKASADVECEVEVKG